MLVVDPPLGVVHRDDDASPRARSSILTRLKRLQLRASSKLLSISFLSDLRLEGLTLGHLFQLPILEALHLYHLRSLRCLTLDDCFDVPFDTLTLGSFTPRSKLFRADYFPRLDEFTYRPPKHGVRGQAAVNRTGPLVLA